MNGYKLVSPQTLKEQLETSTRTRLIDVRGLDEFAAVHVEGALCTPLPQLLQRASEWPLNEDITLICHSGQRALEAANRLGEVGFGRLSVVDGGTKACVDAGVRVVRGRKTLPIQRQVFIGAGLVVLTGLALSLIHPLFSLIAWFAAGSLVVAGITGFCPMAKMLAAAPWNRVHRAPKKTSSSTCVVKGACS